LTRQRLDAYLVQAGLARSRGHAGELVRAGRVLLDGTAAGRPAAPVTPATRIEVVGDPAADFASRAGDKLETALAEFADRGLDVQGRDCLDVGASTGGFTDVLLRRGARSVVAVDVGHDQLRPELRADPRVTALDGVDVRRLATHPYPPDVTLPAAVVVADLSFISLGTVFAALAALTEGPGDLVTLVKPQFEVGRARLPRTGVVRDPEHRAEVLVHIATVARGLGFGLAGAVRCARTGRTGNTEFVVWWRRDAPAADTGALHALAVQEAGGVEDETAADEGGGRTGVGP
jgi:23S rRNA (cytidine1920-2'-O)/16S rRNA (cytidine1409-2'-O)-methyltransferase